MSEKYVSPFPLPTDYEREVLTILIEECAEVIHRATKMLRFGCDEVQPGQDLTNASRLSLEVGDLLQMFALAEDAGLIRHEDVLKGKSHKTQQLEKYMQTDTRPEGSALTQNGAVEWKSKVMRRIMYGPSSS